MCQWNCCRTCLRLESLNPIFLLPDYSDKYSEIIFTVTGHKVEMNDALPQKMCSKCINFINEAIKFRKTCEQAHKQLTERLNNKQYYDIKLETEIFKTEYGKASIDISEYIIDDDFRDYDDNLPLEVFQFSNKTPIEENLTEIAEFETRVQDLMDNPTKIIFNNKTRKIAKKKSVKQAVPRRKKSDKDSNGEKKERVREHIECEYCRKILTSRLSLRNHYKIHTGFDIVCEHCGKKFITQRLLLMHCKAKHGYEKTDKCSYCDYRGSNAEQVKIHERLHTGEKPYVCKECNAGFHRKSSYLQHVAIHLPEKTIQCDQCPSRFKSVTLMRIHKNKHRAPQYTFRCRVCNNSFVRRRNVARHLQRIHGLPPDQHIDKLKIG